MNRIRSTLLLGTLLLSPPPFLVAEAPTGSCPDLPVPAPSSWPNQVEDGEILPIRVLHLAADLDLDGERDRVRAEASSGSLMGSTRLELDLSRRSEPLRVDYEYSLLGFMDVTPIPRALLDTGSSCALELAERVLFRFPLASAADPSLQWLLDSPKRLRWVAGAPPMPRSYVVRDEEKARWIVYAGHNHAERGASDPATMRLLAVEGQKVLLGTKHGVVLTDPERSRHAWVYVFAGGHKLRWASVLGARIQDGTAIVSIETREEGGQTEIRIDLESGHLVESGRAELEEKRL